MANNRVLAVLVDVGYQPAQRAQYPVAVLIELKFLQPSDHPLGDQAEVDVLRNQLEALFPTFGERCVHVADVRGDNHMNMWLYTSKTFDPRPQLLKAFAKWAPKVSLKVDARWSHAGRLCPTNAERQPSSNGWLIGVLRDNGDSITKARPVDHCMFLPSAKACDAIAKRLAPEGFRETGRVKIEDDGNANPLPFMLDLTKKHSVEPDVVDAITLSLVALAEEFEGFYDGWQSSLVK